MQGRDRLVQDEMRAMIEVNAPTYAHAILTAAELVAALPEPARAGGQRAP